MKPKNRLTKSDSQLSTRLRSSHRSTTMAPPAKVRLRREPTERMLRIHELTTAGGFPNYRASVKKANSIIDLVKSVRL